MTYDINNQVRARTRRLIFAGLSLFAALSVVIFAVFILVNRSGGDNANQSQEKSSGLIDQGQTGTQVNTGTDGKPVSLVWSPGPTGKLLPRSPTDGPFELTPQEAKKFAHTEMGAVMAALHISNRARAVSGSNIFDKVITEQMVGAYKLAFYMSCQNYYDYNLAIYKVNNGYPLPEVQTSEYWGYKIIDYTTNSAVVEVLSQSKEPVSNTVVYGGLKIKVYWDYKKNDWMVDAPRQTLDDKYWSTANLPVTYQANGYTRFLRPGEAQ